MNFKRRLAPALFLPLSLTLSIGLLAGCGGSSDGGDARIRLVNATSEYASFDLYQSTSQVSANVATFTAGSYATLGSGTYTFDVKSSGSGTTSASSSRTLAKDVYNTLIAYTTGGSLVTTLLTDSEAAPTSGAAKFRLFNTASTEAGTVDVYLITSDCSAIPSTAAATATNVQTFSTYVEVTAAAAGTPYHVCVTAAGSKTDLRLDIPSLTLTNQQITTLVLTRSTGGVLLHGLVMNQQGTVTAARNTAMRVRLFAGVQGATVNATANGTSLSTGAATATQYRLVPAGALSTTVQATVGLTAGPVVTVSGLSGTAGSDLTLLVTGTAAAPSSNLLIDDNTPSTTSAKPTKLRLVNALNNVAGPATLLVDYSVIADSIVTGVASPAVNVASSSSTALAQVDGQVSGASQYSKGVALTAGRVYSLFLTDAVNAAPNAGALIADR